MSDRLKVGILGGTGMVGQRFISLLENHPWFEVTTIAASPRSAGKTYEEAVGGRWKMDTPMPEAVKKIVVMNVNEVEKVASEVDFVFSAVDMTKEEIKKIEEEYAKTETPVVSNNSAHRWTPDVPMVVPEINAEHMKVIEFQKKRLGTTRGFVAVKPNCSIQSYAPVLTAWKEFEPYEVVATTYQAISGAGKTFKDWPEMEGNIIPYIGGEEEKSEKEPLRICGLSLGALLAIDFAIQHEEKVASLVLIGAQYKVPSLLIDFQNLIFRCMPNKAFESMGLSKSSTIKLAHSMRSLDFTSQLNNIRCPVTILCGKKDTANLKASKRLKELLPQATLHIVPNAGHELNKYAPNTIAEILNQ